MKYLLQLHFASIVVQIAGEPHNSARALRCPTYIPGRNNTCSTGSILVYSSVAFDFFDCNNVRVLRMDEKCIRSKILPRTSI